MNRRVRHLIAPLALMALLACVPTATASPTDVIRTCLAEGSLDGFSDADKRAALNQLAADQDEYSDCRAVIGGSIGGKKGVTAGISKNEGSPAAIARQKGKARKAAARRAQQAREVRRKRARKVREQKLGPRVADPRDAGVFKAAGTANGMQVPVLLAVIALALLAMTGGLLTLWRRNPRFAGAIRRVKVPRFRR
jgi:hypothetical protein